MSKLMPIIVQNRKTREYLKTSGYWTKNVADAHGFSTRSDALKFCEKYSLTDVDLLLETTEKRANGEDADVNVAKGKTRD